MSLFKELVDFFAKNTPQELFLTKLLPFLGIHFLAMLFYRKGSYTLKKRGHLGFHVFLYAFYFSIFYFSIGVFSVIFLFAKVEGTYQADSFPVSDLKTFYLIFFIFFFSRKTNQYLLSKKLLNYKFKKSSVKAVSYLVNLSILFWIFALVYHIIHPATEISENVLFQLITVFTQLCAVVTATYLYYIVNNYYSDLLKKKNHTLGHTLLRASRWPVVMLLLGVSSAYIISKTFDVGGQIYKFVGGVSIIFALFKLVSLGEVHVLSIKKVQEAPNKTLVQGIGNIIRAVLSLLFIMLLWSFFTGKELSGFGAAIGGTGFGIAFAAKSIIENYLSGLVIYFEGSFRVGDWIYFTDKKIEGTIEYIGPRSTAIRTFDKRLLYVPNSLFDSMSIVNASKMTHRRILQKIPVGSMTDLNTLDNIVQEIRLLVYNHPGIDKKQALMVHFTGFVAQGLEITIYAMAITKDWHTYLNVQEHILRESKKIIEKHGGAPPSHVSYRITPPTDTNTGIIEH